MPTRCIGPSLTRAGVSRSSARRAIPTRRIEFRDAWTRRRRGACGVADSEAASTGLSLEELKEKLVDRISETNWFVTGAVERRFFASQFYFKDPSVKVYSLDDYINGVSNLFDSATTMDIVSTKITGDREIEMVWRLEATINFLFKPKIKAYYVTTYFRTNDEGLICEQEEFFSVPEWELLASIFFPNLGTPPAPPVTKS